MDEVPSFVHEEVVSRSGLGNVEEFQTLLVVRERKDHEHLSYSDLHFNFKTNLGFIDLP